MRRHPDLIPQIRRRLDVEHAHAMERDPIVFAVDHRLKHWPQPGIGVGDPFEVLPVEAAADGRCLLKGVVPQTRGLVGFAGREHAIRLDQQ